MSSSSLPPTRRKVRVSRTRRNFTWRSGGISVTSSRKSVPPWAISNVPARRRSAPVNAPFSWPKSSLSTRVGEIAPQLRAMNGRAARRDRRCTVAAATSFPVPLSPVIITGAFERATRVRRRKTSSIGAERPTIPARPPATAGSGSAEARTPRASSCRPESRDSAVASCAVLRGFRRKSWAPAFIASTAARTEPLAGQDQDVAVAPRGLRRAHHVEPVAVREPEVGDADVRRDPGERRCRPRPRSPRPRPRTPAPSPARRAPRAPPARPRRRGRSCRALLGPPPVAGRGQERSATMPALPFGELEATSVGFDASAGEEELLGPLLAARQMKEPLGVRLAAPAEGLDPEGHPPGSGFRAYPRRRPSGSSDRRNPTTVRRASMDARRRRRRRGRDAASSSSGTPATRQRSPIEVSPGASPAMLARRGRRSMSRPAAARSAFDTADPVRQGRPVGGNRREATLEELELQPRGRERVRQGVPERSQRRRPLRRADREERPRSWLLEGKDRPSGCERQRTGSLRQFRVRRPAAASPAFPVARFVR